MSGYTQLTQGQRHQVEALYKAGHNQTKIANILTVHKSTISRELLIYFCIILIKNFRNNQINRHINIHSQIRTLYF